MGASQSTGGAGEPADGGALKTSYYELLGAGRTATQDECVSLCADCGAMMTRY